MVILVVKRRVNADSSSDKVLDAHPIEGKPDCLVEADTAVIAGFNRHVPMSLPLEYLRVRQMTGLVQCDAKAAGSAFNEFNAGDIGVVALRVVHLFYEYQLALFGVYNKWVGPPSRLGP